jgi:serine protein kinase
MTATPKSTQDLLDKLAGDMRQSFADDQTLLSFREYFNLVMASPDRHLRCSPQYLVDMLHHFGREEVQRPYGNFTRFKLFDAPFSESDRRVSGHEAVQEQVYRALANFAREGRVNKLVLLHGPNGSAKSSICAALMAGMEAYSQLPQGVVYSFNWIFPTDKLQNHERIGFGAAPAQVAGAQTYAYLPAHSVDARIPCEMHDHPLFLIPQQHRRDLLGQLLPQPSALTLQAGEKPRTSISDYLRFGDLCYKCRRIFDALLAAYEGDVEKVLGHVQVQRVYHSRRYRRGISTIEPQLSVDARIQQITADRSLAALPKSLQHISLYEPAGPLVDANRGFLEYSDLLKRPVESFKYLLATVETATVSMDSFLLHLDMVFIASTNESYLEAFKEHPDFASFKGRMELIKVPYLLRYSDEKAIYAPHINQGVVGRHVAPHAVEVAALWAVLTRMRRNDAALYPKELAEVIASLTPLEKLRLYDTGETPERLTTGETKELHHRVVDLYREALAYPNYEGRFGASAREMRTALLNAAHHDDYKCLHPLAVFAQIKEILQGRSIYEFLRQEVVGTYHDHAAFLKQTEEIYLSWADDEVRDAMGLTRQESYADLFSRYVTNVSHWVKGEKMLDPKTGQYRHADEKFMGDIEKVLISPGEHCQDFRKAVIGTIGARALESPDAGVDYGVVFRVYIHRLREDFYSARKKELRRIVENFLKVTGGQAGMLDAKDVEQAEAMLATLKGRYHYCDDCARDTVAHLLKSRYAA